MGLYVNNTEAGFRSIVSNGQYVDKTDMLEYMNSVLNTSKKLISFSRPRRFGKSYASHMLTAYYSCGADAKDIFDEYNEAKMSPSSTACCKWGKQSLISGEHISRFVETLIGRKL